MEKPLKIRIVPRDKRPPFSHLLNVLVQLASVELDRRWLALQPDAVEALDQLRDAAHAKVANDQKDVTKAFPSSLLVRRGWVAL